MENRCVCRCSSRGGGWEDLFYTTNVFDQSRSNDFGLSKVDNFVTNGKSNRKRKEVKLWHAFILQNSDCLFRLFRNNSLFNISTISCKGKKSTQADEAMC